MLNHFRVSRKPWIVLIVRGWLIIFFLAVNRKQRDSNFFLFARCEFSGMLLIQFSALRVWKKQWISIQLLKLNFFQTDNLRNLPCSRCLARLFPQYNIEMLPCKWPVLRLHILFPDKTAERSASYPTGTLMIECNQYVLVILSAGPFFYLLAQKLISLVTFV